MGAYPRQEQNPGHWIESTRVAPIIQQWLDDHRAKHNGIDRSSTAFGKPVKNGAPQMCSAGATQTLAFMSGVDNRKINGICRCEFKYVSLDVVDKLLTAMDAVYLFYLPAEESGFSDVYWHESVVGVGEAIAA